MKLETYEFNKGNNSVNIDSEHFLKTIIVYAKKMKIELLEISRVDLPNDITLKLITEEGRYIMPFYRHIKEFIYYNNIFILDTSHIENFEINIRNYFHIEINSETDFNLKMYFSTDRNSAYEDEKYI